MTNRSSLLRNHFRTLGLICVTFSLLAIFLVVSLVAASNGFAAVPKYDAQIASTKLVMPKNQCAKLTRNVKSLQNRVKRASGAQKTKLQRQLNAARKRARVCTAKRKVAQQELRIHKQIQGFSYTGTWEPTGTQDTISICKNGRYQSVTPSSSGTSITKERPFFLRIAKYRSTANYEVIIASKRSKKQGGMSVGLRRTGNVFRIGRVSFDEMVRGNIYQRTGLDANDPACG